MVGYIYHIINIKNNKRYIGKTFNIDRRIQRHFIDLKKQQHHSIKLQRAFNKYGKDSFQLDVQMYEIQDEDELSILEIKEIEKFDSYNNGYNVTLGGEGNRILFDWKTQVLLYNILQHYNGVSRQIARYYDCDHSVIDGLKKNDIYKLEKYETTEYNSLVKELQLSDNNLVDNYIAHNDKKLTNNQCLEILSIITYYNGYDRLLCDIFSINNKLTDRLKKNLIYRDVIEQFNKMSDEEKEQLRLATMKKYDLEQKRLARKRGNVKNPLSQEQINYILDNKDIKTRTQIGKDLGISADRVGSVILGKSYKDLVANYYSSIT